jgi:hypothetical protein
MSNLPFRFFGLLFLGIIITSCSTQKAMRIQVLRPAKVTVPQEIKKLAILNRSIPSQVSLIEGTLSGEKPLTDKDLSEQCLQSLVETLNTSDRFQVVKITEAQPSADPKSLSFSTPLTWEEVDTICQKNDVDGILVLEFYDTDFFIDNPAGAVTQVIQGALQGGNKEITVTGIAKTQAGFRVYFSKDKKIAYEDSYRHSKRWVERSFSVQEALSKMIRKSNALMDISQETGNQFALCVVPLYFWENRVLLKGKRLFKVGERQALSKDWEGALQTWTKIYENSSRPKERAKAAHNIAFAYEVLGDLTNAQKYISKAYVEKGKSVSLEYSNIIDKRVREQEIINEQLKNGE